MKIRNIIKYLGRHSDVTLNSVKDALEQIIKNSITNQEKSWIDKIELLRRKLLKSNTEITIEDYGAISPKFNLAERQMYKGRIIKKTIGQAIGSSVSYLKGLVLFKLIREFKPLNCLELGTALGISSSYQVAALEINKKGRFFTIEGSKTVAKIAQENFKNLGFSRISSRVGRFQDILELVCGEIKPIDFAFIDGHHDEFATINYFKKIFPFLSSKAILVFDDIKWSKGMRNAWKTLTKDNRINFSISLIGLGILIVSDTNIRKKNFKLNLE